MKRAMRTTPREEGARLTRIAKRYAGIWRATGSLSAVASHFLRHVAAKAARLRKNAFADDNVSRDVASARAVAKVPLIALKIGGGLGDYLVMARYLRDLEASSGPFIFDIYANNAAIAQWVFSNLPNMRTCFPEYLFARTKHSYPFALSISQAVTVAQTDGSLEKSQHTAALTKVGAHIVSFAPQIEKLVATQPFFDGDLGEEAVAMGRHRADFLHAMSGIPYGGDRLHLRSEVDTLARFGLAGTPYVTIQNGFDAEFAIRNASATKCYPHFAEVVRLLKKAHPYLKVVQVGTQTSTPIPNVDINLISKTSLSEVAALIQGARLHLDNEGGLVHLASCLGVTSCTIFGPTSVDYFGYPGNINIEPPVCGNCWWATETWMETCPKGYASPLCMTQQRPQDVAARILERSDILNETIMERRLA